MEVNLLTLREILEKYALNPQRNLGQNFLLDLNITDKIVRAAGNLEGRTIIEIGPGPGGLTRSFFRQGAEKVTVIERDIRFKEALDELKLAFAPNLEVLMEDALKVDVSTLGTSPRKIIANLPYNIATVLLFQWLENISAFESLTLMFQKEVAQRLLAKPKRPDYGRLSVMTQWACRVKRVFDISPQAFTPPPKVTSTVVNLIPHSTPLTEVDPQLLSNVVKAAFGQRRKMLRSSLKSIGRSQTEEILNQADIDPTRRAEDLSVIEFCHLAEVFSLVK